MSLRQLSHYTTEKTKEQLEYKTRVVDHQQEVMGGVKNVENIEKVESARCSAQFQRWEPHVAECQPTV